MNYNRYLAEKNILDGFHAPRPRGRFPAPFLVGLLRDRPDSFRRMVDHLPQRLVLDRFGVDQRKGLLTTVESLQSFSPD